MKPSHTRSVRSRSRSESQGEPLILDRPARFAVMRSAACAYRLSNRNVRCWSQIRTVLEQIELMTMSDGYCRLTREVLAARCHCSARTITRLIRLCEELGVLTVVRGQQRCEVSPRTGGDGANLYQLQYDRIRWWARRPPRDAEGESQLTLPFASDEPRQRVQKPVPQKAAPTGEIPRVTWERVELALSDAGVGDWSGLSSVARNNGLTPDDVLAIVDRWRQFPVGHFERPVGALHFKLSNARPGETVDHNWPKLSDTQAAKLAEAQRRDREAAERRRETEQRVQDLQQQRQEQVGLARLESAYGPLLDNLTDEAFSRLVGEAFSEGAAFLLQLARRPGGRDKPLIRQRLLKLLAGRERCDAQVICNARPRHR